MGLTLEKSDSIAPLAEEWNALAEASRNVFATWDFADTWWRCFGEGREPHLYACRRDGALAAILPLYLWRERPVRALRLIGGPDGDELGPIHADDQRGEIAAALRTAIAESEADLLLAENLPRPAGWPQLLEGKIVRREASPVLMLGDGDWDEYLGTRSANFRSVIRRTERKLAAAGASFRLTDANRLDADLDALFRLHAARWRSQTPFLERAAFHREFARRALDRGWLRLWILEAEGAAIGAWYGFRYARVESYYQAGRDPAWNDYRVGLLLLTHSVRAALEDGMSEYRFLRGDEPYKLRFTDLDPGIDSVAVPRTRLGSAAVATVLAARSARRGLRNAAARLRMRAGLDSMIRA